MKNLFILWLGLFGLFAQGADDSLSTAQLDCAAFLSFERGMGENYNIALNEYGECEPARLNGEESLLAPAIMEEEGDLQALPYCFGDQSRYSSPFCEPLSLH